MSGCGMGWWLSFGAQLALCGVFVQSGFLYWVCAFFDEPMRASGFTKGMFLNGGCAGCG